MSCFISDLYGLLLFLGMDPYWVQLWWNRLLYQPFSYGITQPMYDTLSQALWRTAKRDVLDQVCCLLYCLSCADQHIHVNSNCGHQTAHSKGHDLTHISLILSDIFMVTYSLWNMIQSLGNLGLRHKKSKPWWSSIKVLYMPTNALDSRTAYVYPCYTWRSSVWLS